MASMKKFFESGWVNQIFLHTRNFMYSIMIFGIFGAGAYTLEYSSELDLWGIRDTAFASYVIMAIGVLLLLNLIDGLYKLSKLKYRLLLNIFVCVLYLFISFRLAQILLAFKLK